jgi:methionyl-tRNA formyltransferase
MVAVRRTPILPGDDSQTVHDRLARLGADLLLEILPDYVAGGITPQPQPAAGASYAAQIKKEDGHIDWHWPARRIWNRLRAFMPWPGAFTWLDEGDAKPRLLKIWKAEAVDQRGMAGTILRADKAGLVVACGEGALRILELQREGGKRLAAESFLAGWPVAAGAAPFC